MGERNIGIKFALTAVLAAVAFACWKPTAANPFGQVKKGLDLQGGASLLYRIRLEDLPESQRGAVQEQAAAVVQKRLGVLSESKVLPYGSDRILIQIPSADHQTIEKLKEDVRRSGRLECRMVLDGTSDRADIFRRAEKNEERKLPAPPGYHWYTEKIGGLRILVEDVVGMPVKDALEPDGIHAGMSDQTFTPEVHLTLTPTGSEAIDRLAKRAYKGSDSPLNQRMAIILNDVRALPTEEERKRDANAPGRILETGVCYMAPRINAQSFHGKVVISGFRNEAERDELIAVLQAGSLPAPLEFERQTQVGPSLGADQMRKGLTACIAGTALVILFMMLYYLAPGAVACVALLLNLVFLLGIMAALGATMTLPGIAGIVLTLGMAVDANILIFERVREEMAAGKALGQSLHAGYARAFVTIIDTHITTVISAVVLYAMGSEQVRGFAVTLMVGLAASLFTSVLVTRAIFDLALAKGWMSRFRMLHLFPKTSIDFVRLAPWCMICSIIVTVGGLAYVGVLGREMLGTDFTGGRILQLRYAQGQDIQAVRQEVDQVLREGGYPQGPDAQVVQLSRSGSVAAGPSRDFEVVTRNLDLDADRVRKILRQTLGASLASIEETKGVAAGHLGFDLAFTGPQDLAAHTQSLRLAGLKDADLQAAGEGGRAARLSVTPRLLVGDLKARLGDRLSPSAFRMEPLRARHTRVVCAVRDMTADQVRARLATPAVNLPGCDVEVGKPDARGVAPFTLRCPMTDVEEIKTRLLRHFGPELCLQDVPYAKINPDGTCHVEIRLQNPMKITDIATKREDIRKALGLQLGSSSELRGGMPEDPPGTGRDLICDYKDGMKDLMQFLFMLRQPGSDLPLVEPFQDAQVVPSSVRLTFSVLDASQGIAPAQRAAQAVKGTLTEAALVAHPGGFHASLELDEDQVHAAEAQLREGYGQDLSDPFPRDDVVGSVVAAQAIKDTGMALLAAWAALILYIAFRFEFISGVAAIVALIHDVCVALAVLAITHTQIDMTVVAALLTIVGYSVNDTIVVFDRIRENLGGRWDVTGEEFGRVVNLSVNQTLARTILTSTTVFIAVLSLFAGGEVFRGFAIAMLAGVITGTYSSVYIAAPLAKMWRRRAALAKK